LSNGGFQALVNLFQHFIAKNQLMRSQADRNCVLLLTYLIKVILMSSFCADISDGELVISLTRKMSSDGNRSVAVKSQEDS